MNMFRSCLRIRLFALTWNPDCQAAGIGPNCVNRSELWLLFPLAGTDPQHRVLILTLCGLNLLLLPPRWAQDHEKRIDTALHALWSHFRNIWFSEYHFFNTLIHPILPLLKPWVLGWNCHFLSSLQGSEITPCLLWSRNRMRTHHNFQSMCCLLSEWQKTQWENKLCSTVS